MWTFDTGMRGCAHPTAGFFVLSVAYTDTGEYASTVPQDGASPDERAMHLPVIHHVWAVLHERVRTSSVYKHGQVRSISGASDVAHWEVKRELLEQET